MTDEVVQLDSFVEQIEAVGEAIEQGKAREALELLLEIREAGIIDRRLDRCIDALRDGVRGEGGDVSLVRNWVEQALGRIQGPGGRVFDDLEEMSAAGISEDSLVPVSETEEVGLEIREVDRDGAQEGGAGAPAMDVEEVPSGSVAPLEVEEVDDGPADATDFEEVETGNVEAIDFEEVDGQTEEPVEFEEVETGSVEPMEFEEVDAGPADAMEFEEVETGNVDPMGEKDGDEGPAEAVGFDGVEDAGGEGAEVDVEFEDVETGAMERDVLEDAESSEVEDAPNIDTAADSDPFGDDAFEDFDFGAFEEDSEISDFEEPDGEEAFEIVDEEPTGQFSPPEGPPAAPSETPEELEQAEATADEQPDSESERSKAPPPPEAAGPSGPSAPADGEPEPAQTGGGEGGDDAEDDDFGFDLGLENPGSDDSAGFEIGGNEEADASEDEALDLGLGELDDAESEGGDDDASDRTPVLSGDDDTPMIPGEDSDEPGGGAEGETGVGASGDDADLAAVSSDGTGGGPSVEELFQGDFGDAPEQQSQGSAEETEREPSSFAESEEPTKVGDRDDLIAQMQAGLDEHDSEGRGSEDQPEQPSDQQASADSVVGFEESDESTMVAQSQDLVEQMFAGAEDPEEAGQAGVGEEDGEGSSDFATPVPDEDGSPSPFGGGEDEPTGESGSGGSSDFATPVPDDDQGPSLFGGSEAELEDLDFSESSEPTRVAEEEEIARGVEASSVVEDADDEEDLSVREEEGLEKSVSEARYQTPEAGEESSAKSEDTGGTRPKPSSGASDDFGTHPKPRPGPSSFAEEEEKTAAVDSVDEEEFFRMVSSISDESGQEGEAGNESTGETIANPGPVSHGEESSVSSPVGQAPPPESGFEFQGDESTGVAGSELENSTSAEQSAASRKLSSGAVRLLDEAEQLLEKGHTDSAHDLVQSVLDSNPDSERAARLLERVEADKEPDLVEQVGGLDTVPKREVEMGELAGQDFDHRYGFVLSLVDGQMRVDDILELSSMSRSETLSVLANMLEDGILSKG